MTQQEVETYIDNEFNFLRDKMKKQILDWFISGETTPAPPAVVEANFFHDTVSVADGTANLFIRTPYDLDNPPSGGWPVILFYGGDGSDVTTNTVTNAAVTDISSGVAWQLNLSLSGVRLLRRSVVIKIDGTPYYYCDMGGNLVPYGADAYGINGAVGNAHLSTPDISFEVTTPITGSVTCDYVTSAMLIEGPPYTINSNITISSSYGDDLDERCIFCAVQNVSNNLNYELDYFDKVVEKLYNDYSININRISATGISRGGVFVVEASAAGAGTSILKSRYQFWVDTTTGVVYTSAGTGRTQTGLASLASIAGGYGTGFTWSNYTNIGTAFIHGTSDGTVTNETYSIANAGNITTLNEYPQIQNLQGVGHSTTAWHTNYAFRKYANGGIARDAQWDYVDFLLKYSFDATECATLHVEQAEKRRLGTEEDIIEYRHALRKVNALSAGDAKTSLLARLATLKTDIAGTGTYYFVNPHNFGNDGSTPPYNDITNMLTGNSVDNIVSDTGGASSIDFDIVSSPHAAVADARLGLSNRCGFTGGFEKAVNNSGYKCVATNSTIGFGELPAGNYNIRFWHSEGTANFTNNATLKVIINGVTKTQYSACNSLLGYIQYTNIDASHLATGITVARNNDRDTALTCIELYRQ